jgi:hypothetical protein
MKRVGGELIKIGSLFEKYQKTLKPPQKTIEKACREVIFELTNITLTPEQVRYTVSTKTIYIQAPSILKNELKLRSQEILEALQKQLRGSSPSHFL